MTEGDRYRVTWKHPRARRRRMVEGVYWGTRGDHYALERRDGRVLLVDSSHSVRWHGLLPSLV